MSTIENQILKPNTIKGLVLESPQPPALSSSALIEGADNSGTHEAFNKQQTAVSEQQRKVNEAEWFSSTKGELFGDKWDGWWQTATSSNLNKLIDYVQFDMGMLRGDDEDWKRDALSEDKVNYDMARYGFSSNEVFNDLIQAKNPDHYDSLTELHALNKIRSTMMDETLNSYGGMLNERTVSTFSTNLFDAENLITGGASILAKVAKIRKIATAGSITSQVALQKVMYEVDETMTVDEALFFSALNSVIDLGLVNKVANDATAMAKYNSAVEASLLIGKTDSFLEAVSIRKNYMDKYGTSIEEGIGVEKKVDEGVEPTGETTIKQEAMDEVLDTELEATRQLDEVEANLSAEIENLKQARSGTTKKKTVKLEKEIKRLEKRLDKQVTQRKKDAKIKSDLERDIRLKLEREIKRIKKMGGKVKKGIDKINARKAKLEADRIMREMKEVAPATERAKEVIVARFKSLKKDLDMFGETPELLKEVERLKTQFVPLVKSGVLTQSTADQIMHAIKTADGTAKLKDPIKISTNNEFISVDKKKVKQVGKAAAIAAVLGGTTLSADDGTFVNNSTLGSIALLVAIGLLSPTIFRSAKRSFDTAYQGTQNAIKNKEILGSINALYTKTRATLTDTHARLTQKENPKFTKFVDNLLTDSMNGYGGSVEQLKKLMVDGIVSVMQSKIDNAYNDYIKLGGTSAYKRWEGTFGRGYSYKQNFDRLVWRYVKFGEGADNPAIKKAGDAVAEANERVYDQMKASGMDVAHITPDKNYMPRSINHSFKTSLASMGDDAYQGFVKQFAKMLVKSKNPLKTADTYLAFIKKHQGRSYGAEFTDDVTEFMKSKGIEQAEVDDLMAMLGANKEFRYGRTKDRIAMDERLFEEYKFTTVDGLEMTMTIDDIFNTSAIDSMYSYINATGGHVALAKKGYTTTQQALDEARGASLEANAKVAEDIVNLLTGKPLYDPSGTAAKVLTTLRNYTAVLTLPRVVMSMIPEMFKTMAGMNMTGYKAMMGELTQNLLRKHGARSNLVSTLMREYGAGTHGQRARFGFRGIESMDNMPSHIEADGVVAKVGEYARDIVLYGYGMIPASDFMSRIVTASKAQDLADVASGTKKMSPFMKKVFGITPEIEKFIAKEFKMTKGVLDDLDMSGWTQKQKDDIGIVLDNMRQKEIQEVSLGGTPHFMRNTELGAAAGYLLSFPLQAFNNHGALMMENLAGEGKALDALGQQSLWFSGAYLSLALKASLDGKDINDEAVQNNMLLMAMLQTPIIGAASVPVGLSDPAVFGTAQEATTILNVYGH